jgi:hypothetical protein
MIHFRGPKAGTGTYRHDRAHPSTPRPHERSAADPDQTGENA